MAIVLTFVLSRTIPVSKTDAKKFIHPSRDSDLKRSEADLKALRYLKRIFKLLKNNKKKQ